MKRSIHAIDWLVVLGWMIRFGGGSTKWMRCRPAPSLRKLSTSDANSKSELDISGLSLVFCGSSSAQTANTASPPIRAVRFQNKAESVRQDARKQNNPAQRNDW